MAGFQDFVEKVKYADAALKKKIVLGALAGVLFIVAGVMIFRVFFGTNVEPVPTETEQAASELRDKLASEESTQTEVDDPAPFVRSGQEAPR